MSLYGVIGYHVTLWEGHMIANHPIYGVITMPGLVVRSPGLAVSTLLQL